MKNTKNTINNQTQLLNFFNNHSTMSLEENDNTKSKTPKEKLVYSIQKEIDILNNRNDLTLLQLSKKGDTYTNSKGEKSTYKNDRFENRFWKSSSNGKLFFNLKYKGKIIPIINGKDIVCNNSVESLLLSLNQIKTQIELLDDSDVLFQNTIFKSSK